MTHIGSGYAAEADASLDVLSDLVESHPDIMAPFAIFIKVSITVCVNHSLEYDVQDLIYSL